jgi:hypothetical protein
MIESDNKIKITVAIVVAERFEVKNESSRIVHAISSGASLHSANAWRYSPKHSEHSNR